MDNTLGKSIYSPLFFYYRDAPSFAVIQNIISAILNTDAINIALSAGRTVQNILQTVRQFDYSPQVNNMIDFILPKVESAINIASIAEKVRQTILGGTDDTLVPFTRNGANIRQGDEPQSIFWQLAYLFTSKADKSALITMTMVEGAIAKALAEIRKGQAAGGGGGDQTDAVEQAALDTLSEALNKLTQSFTAAEGERANMQTSLQQAVADLSTNKTSLQRLMSDLNTFKRRFDAALPLINAIGPIHPDFAGSTVWEEINKIATGVGKNFLKNFRAADTNAKTIVQRIIDIETALQNMKESPSADDKQSYQSLVTSLRTITQEIQLLKNRHDNDIVETKKLDAVVKVVTSLRSLVGNVFSDGSFTPLVPGLSKTDIISNLKDVIASAKELKSEVETLEKAVGIPEGTIAYDVPAEGAILAKLAKLDKDVKDLKLDVIKGAGGASEGGGDTPGTRVRVDNEKIKQLEDNVTGFQASLTTISTQIRKLNLVISTSFIQNFNTATSDSIYQLIQQLNGLYNTLVGKINQVENKIPSKNLDVILGAQYVHDFVPGTTETISSRLDMLETSLAPSSGTAVGRKYWYDRMYFAPKINVSTLSDATSKASKAPNTWSVAEKDFVNRQRTLLPFNYQMYKEDKDGQNIFGENGGFPIFKGKSYLILGLRFQSLGVNTQGLTYEISVESKSSDGLDNITNLGDDRRTIDRDNLSKTSSHKFVEIHVFQFRNTANRDNCFVRFGWRSTYPHQDTMFLEADILYFAPIYYNENSGKGYLNPHPSMSQVLSHPSYTDMKLYSFAIKSNNPDNVFEYEGIRVGNKRIVVIDQNRVVHESDSAETAFANWTDPTFIYSLTKSPSVCYIENSQGLIDWTYLTENVNIQAWKNDPQTLRHDLAFRIFRNRATKYRGLFLFGFGIPGTTCFGLETRELAIKTNAVCLSGEPSLICELYSFRASGTFTAKSVQSTVFQLPCDFDNTQQMAITAKDTGSETSESALVPAKDHPMRLLKRITIIPDHVPNENVTYMDPLTKKKLAANTVTYVNAHHLLSTTWKTWSFGTIDPPSDPYQNMFVAIYPKYPGTDYDFVFKGGPEIVFGKDGEGIMAEGVFNATYYNAYPGSTFSYNV